MKLLRAIIILSIMAVGCAAPTGDVGGVDEALIIPRSVWEQAPPCGDEPVDHIVRCELEPSLGAALDANGDIICVDAIDALVVQRASLVRMRIDVPLHDPAPQPNLQATQFRSRR